MSIQDCIFSKIVFFCSKICVCIYSSLNSWQTLQHAQYCVVSKINHYFMLLFNEKILLWSDLDSLQSSFSCPPPVAPPPSSLPPKPTPHAPPTTKMSSLSMRENRNKHSDISGSQHMFKRSVVTCKIPFQKTIHMHNHLCETCKVGNSLIFHESMTILH